MAGVTLEQKVEALAAMIDRLSDQVLSLCAAEAERQYGDLAVRRAEDAARAKGILGEFALSAKPYEALMHWAQANDVS